MLCLSIANYLKLPVYICLKRLIVRHIYSEIVLNVMIVQHIS